MVWIREAEELGRREAERVALGKVALEEAKAKFEAEEVTEEALSEHLAKYQGLIDPILEDLRGAGYEVRASGPKFLHHSYVGEGPIAGEDLSQVSLTRVVDSGGWGMTDYTKRERQVFGSQWEIFKPGDAPDYERAVGTLAIYPWAAESTHYGGAQYRVLGTNDRDLPVQGVGVRGEPLSHESLIATNAQVLRKALGRLVSQAQLPRS